MPEWLTPLVAVFGTGGVITTACWIWYKLHQDSIQSQRERADDWRTVAQTTAEANKVMAENVDRLVVSVSQLAATQKEMMASQRDMINQMRDMMALLQRTTGV